MGIPAFYRWLLERYPQSVVEVNEETPAVINGVTVPIDTSDPNPNGIEFDNLYLDMNGIIHPCFHPEGLPAPETHEEVFKAVFKYIDRIFSIVRPRKLLYMAIDGVAPRAKMNQQRARRFRAAKDAGDEASDTGRIRRNDETEREDLSTKKLDSNVITPGTKFMELLSSALQYYIRLKVNVDSGWQGIKVILSDASVPGEGEHKIMSYIRLQRNLPGFDPNTRHCLYGLDADLIMLALASHEVHFSILREDVRKDKSKYKGQQNRQDMYRQQAGRHSKKGEGGGKDLENLISEQKFQFLKVWVLRDYLGYELQIPDPTVKLDLERLIDDFVFMCLFVGNDFLPHVPSLEISEGAIDLLIDVYKKEFVNMGGYLTNSCQVNLERAGHFIQAIGSYENAVFRKRIQVQKHWGIHMQRPTLNLAVQKKQDKSNHVQAKTLSVVDKVKLGEEGWKERYYLEKFDVQTEEDCVKIQRDVVLKYVEGICWVMHYYYQGVCSWQWFYPYHYAPFASDFHDLDRLKIHFTIGKPFKPFDQLMGVLPAASAQALPVSYRKLMTDPLSPILDFYPSDFELDMNGKRHAWQAVCKLPFIEESRLLSEIANVEDTLTVDEKHRNSLGLDMLFVYLSHPLATKILAFCARNKDNPKLPKAKVKRKINPEFSHGMNGFIYLSDKPVCRVEVYPPVEDMDVITDNKVISVFYKVPSFHPHIPRPPKGVTMPRKVISKDGVHPQPLLWHEKTAVAEHRYSRRCIPHNSVSGPRLAKLAHQLVSENCFLKHQVNGDGGNDSHSKKRKKKRSADRKKRTGAERKKRKKQRQDTVVC
ncbi:5'-3' exoribonuclease 4-like isoform X1 [Nicotiana sylvestris]|uniref:5'-3' exoribonuclease 4-like isoform X1 n=1 Tax=Nicotiana sylvestris TaxID=4096 RepID=UPI00388C4E70